MEKTTMYRNTVLISGATSGIGKATAIALANKNHNLILLGRNKRKLKETTLSVLEKVPNAKLSSYAVDFSDLTSVNHVVHEIQQNHPVIDILINNAGAIQIEPQKTPEGLEKTLVVNYYSHFVVTMGLLENIKAAKNGRIINVSSDCYKLPGYAIDDEVESQKYNWNRAYNRSKLAQVQFTHKLQNTLSDSNVVATCISPGAVKTKIYDPMPKLIRWLTSLSLKPVEKGVKDIVEIATQADVSQYAGAFVSGGKVKKVHSRFLQLEHLDNLWRLSTKQIFMPQPQTINS
jgi:short-subunit dehydrogenase